MSVASGAVARTVRAVLAVLALSLCLAPPAFAQKAGTQTRVTQFLTKADVDAFVKNHEAIKTELAKAGISERDFGFDISVAPDFDTLNFLNSITTPPRADAIFARYGMGKNGMRKLFVMNWAAEVAIFERLLKPGSGEPGIMDAKAYDALMAKYRECINPEDYKLVAPRCDELSAIFTADGAGSYEPESGTENMTPGEGDEAAEFSDDEPSDDEDFSPNEVDEPYYSEEE